jgi:hypothetical protein
MIEPTNGRVVWFRPGGGDALFGEYVNAGCQPLAATIARVWSPTMVNLSVLSPDGVPQPRTSVFLLQPEDPRVPAGSYCEWMPYQKGQAAKAEALQAKVDHYTDAEREAQLYHSKPNFSAIPAPDFSAGVNGDDKPATTSGN